MQSLGARDLRELYIKRPDPKEAADGAKGSVHVQAPGLSPDASATTTVISDYPDTPTAASDVEAADPAHNAQGGDSGQDHIVDADVVDDPATSLASLIEEGKLALEMPQRHEPLSLFLGLCRGRASRARARNRTCPYPFWACWAGGMPRALSPARACQRWQLEHRT